MGVVTQGAEKYRAAEKQAKEKKMRIWKDYTPTASTATFGSIKEREFTGKVRQSTSCDSISYCPLPPSDVDVVPIR